MSSLFGEPDRPGDEPPSNGRLDSWKEIASYLRRSVRSAKRWEKEQQLPVHRHHHDKRDSVYAYRAELDTWWKNRGAKLSDQNGVEEGGLPSENEPLEGVPDVGEPERPKQVLTPSLQRPRRTALVVAGFGLAVVLAGVIAWLSRNGSGPSAGSLRPLPFKARDWVLVTRFENRTGRPIFDGTLEAALERELRNSRYLNVVPRERINDALSLMRKPDETRIDATLGREICLRDGDIRALVTGRIEKLDSKFLLSVNLLDPARGVTVAGVAEEAAGESEALPAIRRASDRLRTALGEALPEMRPDEAKLAKVTTRSLKALQLYSQAEPLAMKKPRAAQELLRQAVAEDPEFAAGHILLSEAIFNETAPGPVAEEHRAHAETALRLSEFASDRERYWIRGWYYDLTGDTEKAAAAYEALLALYPDDVGALNNLVPIYGRLGRGAESLRCALRRADLTPNDFRNQFLAMIRSIDSDPAGADRYSRRARALISDDVLDRVPQQAALIEMFPAFRLWAEGNVGKGAAEADRIWREIQSKPLGSRDAGLQSIASFFLSMGKLRAAEDVYQRISSQQMRLRGLAMVSYYRGDERGLVDHLKAAVAHPEEIPLWGVSGVPPGDPVLGILLARAGMFSDAERIVAREKKRESIGGFVEVVQGELALARGRKAEAIRMLRICCNPGGGPGPSYYFGTESLASALDNGGDTEEAIRVLEEKSRWKAGGNRSNQNIDAHAWLRIRAMHAKLCRKIGREDEARKIEEDLLKFLSQADPDHALLVALKKSQARDTIASGKPSQP